MNQEIERKFLASQIPVETLQLVTDSVPIQQGYLCCSEDAEVRIRKKGNKAFLTTKKGHGISRQEVEISITEDQFQELWPATAGKRIEKVRSQLKISNDLVAEIDVFSGENQGLILIEVEFENEMNAHQFRPPAWFGIDVTFDNAYRNAFLAK